MKPKSRQQLLNDELRRRLAEAEETLEAIRTGAVDALVVGSGAAAPRLYTLEGAERPYRLLIEQMQQGAATLQPEGMITYCNPRLSELLGAPAMRVVGSRLQEHVASADQPWLDALLSDARAGTAQGETHLERADGLPIPVYLTISTLHSEQGAPLCVLVTDLSDAKFEDLYEHSPDMMCSVDASTGTVLQCNETLSRVLGRPKREILGRPVLELYAPECIERARGNFHVFQSCGEVQDDELVLLCADGRRLHVSLSVSAVRDACGRIVRSRSVLRDITDRKRAEVALREADRRKDEFLAILAHELRNPLAPIRSAIDIQRLKAPQDPDLRWTIDVIDRQLQQMTRLVDDLMDVSRITRNRIELRLERVSVMSVVQRAIEACEPVLEARGHHLQLNLPQEPLWLRADAARIAQVLGNLLHNAAKYTPAGGRIELRAARAGDEVLIELRDNGIGIAPELLPRVFDMFVQAETARERSHGGLGIGLTLVRSLVQLHGGRVEVHSEGLNRGSVFSVRLPLAVSEVPRAPDARDAASAEVRARRILVVDDNRDAAVSLQLLLGQYGHEVHAAFSGPEAIGMAPTLRPEIVLMDVGMPMMNGYEAARAIAALPGMAQVLFIALTGWGQESDHARSRAAGFAHHLTKPVDTALLQRLIGELAPAPVAPARKVADAT